MKVSTFSIATLAVVAAAQPYHRHHNHHHPHPARRQASIVDVVTDIVYATEAAAVVYVNQAGQPVSTSFLDQPAQTPVSITSTPTPTSTPSQATSAFIPPAPAINESNNQAPTSDTAPAAATSSATSTSNTGNQLTSSFGYGLSYSPYNNDGTCKTQSQINQDLNPLTDYNFIRSYGVDCNQASTILSAVQAKGMKMFAGIYDINNVASETQQLISAVQDNWSSISAVTVGNEVVNNGIATVPQVLNAINTARTMLRAAGYTGPVVTVDTSAQIISNPELCEASDFAAANCHAFFNADLMPDQAGPWVAEQAERIQQACGGKDTMITESGWPNQGQANGLAVPSVENAAVAITSLKSSFKDNIVLFSAYNDLWETNTPATFGTNQWWGIFGDSPSG